MEVSKRISHEEAVAAGKGIWRVQLTPVESWIGDVSGRKELGLASGGGQQMPVLRALGAECTLLDCSEKQLAADKAVADEEGYSITLIRHDMPKLLPFPDESFDIIIHPVSDIL